MKSASPTKGQKSLIIQKYDGYCDPKESLLNMNEFHHFEAILKECSQNHVDKNQNCTEAALERVFGYFQ